MLLIQKYTTWDNVLYISKSCDSCSVPRLSPSFSTKRCEAKHGFSVMSCYGTTRWVDNDIVAEYRLHHMYMKEEK